jgi:hypothetical protein
MVTAVVSALISGGKAKPDLDELGKLAGMTLKEIRQTTADPNATDPNATGTGAAGDPTTGPAESGTSTGQTAATVKEIVARVRPQVENAMRDGRFGPDLRLNMGFKNRFRTALEADGVMNPSEKTEQFYSMSDVMMQELVRLDNEFSTPDSFVSMVDSLLTNQVKELVR